ncbi:hypothetical protein Trydic_g11834 [Trypoxylus dichotomus]
MKLKTSLLKTQFIIGVIEPFLHRHHKASAQPCKACINVRCETVFRKLESTDPQWKLKKSVQSTVKEEENFLVSTAVDLVPDNHNKVARFDEDSASDNYCNEFIRLFVSSFEDKLSSLRKYQYGNPDKAQTTTFANICSAAATTIPYAGKTIAGAISYADQYRQQYNEKKEAHKLIPIIFFYDRNRDECRNILIEAGVEIYDSYQQQFSSVTTEYGRLRAMQKLGTDACARLFSYLTSNNLDQTGNLTVDIITRGVVHGVSPRHPIKRYKGKSLITAGKRSITTSKFFGKVSVCIPEADGTRTCLGKKGIVEELGHRSPFPWESVSDIISTHKIKRSACTINHNFNLKEKNKFVEGARQYITSQISSEDIKTVIRMESKDMHEEVNVIQEQLKEINQRIDERNGDQPTAVILRALIQCLLHVQISRLCYFSICCHNNAILLCGCSSATSNYRNRHKVLFKTMELEDRLKEFTYIFIRSFEEKLKYWQKYLEDRPDKLKSSKSGTILSTAVSVIPQVGKGLAGVVKHGDEYVQNRIESTTAQDMAEITYFSDNNKDTFRLVLIEGAYEIFCKYEYQFSLVSCNGGALRAMHKLGSDATHRIISFLLENKSINNLTPELVTKGIVCGKSPRHSKKVVTSGRTLILNEETVSTADFFMNTGIRLETDNVITYYKHKDSIHVLRHRLPFLWEDRDQIITTYQVDRPEYSYKYQLISRNKAAEVEAVRQFVTTKNPIEDVKEFIRVKEDELETLIKSTNEEIKEMQTKGMDENKEHHHLTREFIAKTEESIITYLNNMIFETLKQSLEEDRKKREEYDRLKREEEENRERVKEEERRKKAEEEQRLREEERQIREEEERKRKEEAEMLIEKMKEQQQQQVQLPEKAIIIDGDRLREEGRRVEDCLSRESKKVEREARRIADQVKSFKFKW